MIAGRIVPAETREVVVRHELSSDIVHLLSRLLDSVRTPTSGGTLGDVGARTLQLVPREDGTEPTIADLLERWRQFRALEERSASHIDKACRYIARAAQEHGWTRPSELTTEGITAHLASMKRRGNSAKLRNDVRSYFKTFCDYLCSPAERAIAENPAIGTARAKRTRKAARIVPTEQEVRALIAAAASDWRKKDRWLVYLTAATAGLRLGTLRALEWCHVREEAAPPHLDLPGDLVKNGEPTIVWLTAELAKHLAEHRKAAGRRSRVFLGVPAKSEHFDRDLKKAGITKKTADGRTLSFHSLRHFASNRMAWSGFADSERAQQNGHRSIDVTRKIYTDPTALELGRKVLSLPDLLPPEGTGRRRGRGKNVDRSGSADDTGGETSAMNPLHEINPDPISPASAARRTSHLPTASASEAGRGSSNSSSVGTVGNGPSRSGNRGGRIRTADPVRPGADDVGHVSISGPPEAVAALLRLLPGRDA